MNKKMKRKQSNGEKQPQFKFVRTAFTLIVGLIFLSGVAVFASKGGESLLSYIRPTVKVNLSGTVSRDNGKVELSKAGAVKPGEILEWKIVSENNSQAKASRFKAVGQIPAGTKFVAGSARAEGSAIAKYSIDGGQSYSEKPMIKAKQADGSEKLVAAPASMYTQVRFEWKKPLDSGESFKAFYSTRVE
ncbi:MAG: hypothetical protein HKN25_05665 [Pyrinomonadaceae bacterium]|nr:hypothetical protein [Pyrinomonadaceae bacterium]